LVRGYANNLFALGLTLWALAAHVSLRRSTPLRVMVSSGSAVVIFFCHLFALGVFALVETTWELGYLLEEGLTPHRVAQHVGAALLPLVLPMVLLALSSSSQDSGVIEFGFLQIWTKLKLCLEVLAVGNRVGDSC
jgi:hypothetical protein